MTHTYSITGMTCGNCVAKVKSELLKLGDVLEADVQLNSPQATISMQKHIPVSVLQNVVAKAGNYTISETGHPNISKEMNTGEAEGWRAYWPLFLVFIFIIGIATITSFQEAAFYWMDWMDSFMGGFFIAFSFFKLLDLTGFADSYSTYDVLAMRWRPYGFIYPFLELGLGIAFITHFEPLLTNIATIVLMGFSSIGVINSVLNKRKIQCACLGTVFNLPMSTVTIVEDLLMVAMALANVIILNNWYGF
jgi:copper chaperone CopZ